MTMLAQKVSRLWSCADRKCTLILVLINNEELEEGADDTDRIFYEYILHDTAFSLYCFFSAGASPSSSPSSLSSVPSEERLSFDGGSAMRENKASSSCLIFSSFCVSLLSFDPNSLDR